MSAAEMQVSCVICSYCATSPAPKLVSCLHDGKGSRLEAQKRKPQPDCGHGHIALLREERHVHDLQHTAHGVRSRKYLAPQQAHE